MCVSLYTRLLCHAYVCVRTCLLRRRALEEKKIASALLSPRGRIIITAAGFDGVCEYVSEKEMFLRASPSPWCVGRYNFSAAEENRALARATHGIAYRLDAMRRASCRFQIRTYATHLQRRSL